MIILVILGGIMVVLGLLGLAHCIREGYRVKARGGEPGEIHARLQRLVAVNLGSVALAALGLGLLVVGLTLG
jgi:hypothetical protein